MGYKHCRPIPKHNNPHQEETEVVGIVDSQDTSPENARMQTPTKDNAPIVAIGAIRQGTADMRRGCKT